MRPPADAPEHPGLEPLAARVLAARGLTRIDDARHFLRPSLGDLHDPSLLPGVDRAATILLDALRSGRRVAIYGDYDADGVTATCVLYHVLRALDSDSDLVTFIPHRIDDGYGLNAGALEQLASEGVQVVVSVDCGITAVGEAARARELGLTLIITDHHTPPPQGSPLPDAEVLVHPRVPGSMYPFGELSGVGVAFKLAWRLATLASGGAKASGPVRDLLVRLLPLVAIGTVADVVPLVGENRVLVAHGLRRMRDSGFDGLDALIAAARLDADDIDARRIAFSLAPRLNACGRLGHARDAVRMLTTAPADDAATIAGELCALNDERRAIEKRITERAMQLAEEAGMTGDDRRAIVLASQEWHPGVVGIAASRLVERFCRPTLLLCADAETGEIAGSARSIEGYDLAAALHRCSAHLRSHGGHAMAAGLRLDASSLDAFTEALVGDANARLGEDDLIPAITVDAEAAMSELTPRAARQLTSLEPFGAGNPTPRVRLTGVQLAEQPRALGKTGRHAALRVEGGGRSLRVVAWNWASEVLDLRRGQRVTMVVEPELSEWNGRVSVEPRLVDFAID